MIVQSGPHVETIITLEQHKANDIKLALWLSSNVIIVSNDITLTMTIQGHNCLVLISTEPFRWVSGGWSMVVLFKSFTFTWEFYKAILWGAPILQLHCEILLMNLHVHCIVCEMLCINLLHVEVE